jgi:hypothetical protein
VPDENPPSPCTIENAAPRLPDGLAGLRREAGDEGIRIVGVIVDRWLDGRIVAVGASPGVRTSTVRCESGASTSRRPRDVRASPAPSLWASLGFRSVDTDGITHQLDVMTSDGAPTMMDR